jgi:dihydrofolate synthase/folylpolyglutamate synthase
VAHNEASVKVLAQELAKNQQPTLAVFSALKDKHIALMINAIAPLIDEWIIAPLKVKRGADIDLLADEFSLKDKISVVDDTHTAINKALNQTNYQRVVIFGSFYIVADALKMFK